MYMSNVIGSFETSVNVQMVLSCFCTFIFSFPTVRGNPVIDSVRSGVLNPVPGDLQTPDPTLIKHTCLQ